MDIKRALISAFVLYALIFLIASGLMFVLKDYNVFGAATLVAGIAATYFISNKYYFAKVKVKDAVKDGLMLGLVFVIVTFLLDVPLLVYGFAKDQGWNFFMAWHVIIGYISALVVPVIAAKMKK